MFLHVQEYSNNQAETEYFVSIENTKANDNKRLSYVWNEGILFI